MFLLSSLLANINYLYASYWFTWRHWQSNYDTMCKMFYSIFVRLDIFLFQGIDPFFKSWFFRMTWKKIGTCRQHNMNIAQICVANMQNVNWMTFLCYLRWNFAMAKSIQFIHFNIWLHFYFINTRHNYRQEKVIYTSCLYNEHYKTNIYIPFL